MKTLKTLALATAVSTGLLGAVGAMAATQGAVGGSSTGDFDVSFIKPGEVAIWGMRDIPFTADGTKTLQACVYSSTTDVQFQLNTDTEDFGLHLDPDNPDANPAITFTVDVKDKNSASELWGDGGLAHGNTSIKTFGVIGAAKPANPASDICTGTDQTIDIDVTVAGTSGAADGEYTNTVELVVSAI
ncbi:hypothetical protein [Endozoicomonas sp. ONNA2]|uniref:hypothetical protein n=1 Tax=Endozoicomonas sp. ONNA2 TaxID=2828741 RepID=UPI0021498174|nr:hypothetical protein [Endozoicomonas sp. ONNA2]